MVHGQQGRVEDLHAPLPSEDGGGEFQGQPSREVPPQVHRQSRKGQGPAQGAGRLFP